VNAHAAPVAAIDRAGVTVVGTGHPGGLELAVGGATVGAAVQVAVVTLLAQVYDAIPACELVGADVAGSALGSGHTALIRSGAGTRSIDGRAAREEGMRLREASVVGQRTEVRIDPNQILVTDQTPSGERTDQIRVKCHHGWARADKGLLDCAIRPSGTIGIPTEERVGDRAATQIAATPYTYSSSDTYAVTIRVSSVVHDRVMVKLHRAE
jgi:hypothetical protein